LAFALAFAIVAIVFLLIGYGYNLLQIMVFVKFIW